MIHRTIMNINKAYLAIVATAVALTGCQNEDFINNSGGNANAHQQLQFNVSVENGKSWNSMSRSTASVGNSVHRSEPVKMQGGTVNGLPLYLTTEVSNGIAPKSSTAPVSRGSNLTLDSPEFNYFGATAWYLNYTGDSPDQYIFKDEFVRRSGNSWNMEHQHYLPLYNTNCTVYACFPYYKKDSTKLPNNISTSDNLNFNSEDPSRGTQTVLYEVPDNATEQVDLMCAYGSPDENNIVDLNFKHALSAIKFKTAADMNFPFTVKSVTLKNLYYKGKVYFNDRLAASRTNFTYYNLRKDFKQEVNVAITGTGNEPIIDGENTFMMLPYYAEYPTDPSEPTKPDHGGGNSGGGNNSGKNIKPLVSVLVPDSIPIEIVVEDEVGESTLTAKVPYQWERGKTYTYNISYDYFSLSQYENAFLLVYFQEGENKRKLVPFYYAKGNHTPTMTGSIAFRLSRYASDNTIIPLPDYQTPSGTSLNNSEIPTYISSYFTLYHGQGWADANGDVRIVFEMQFKCDKTFRTPYGAIYHPGTDDDKWFPMNTIIYRKVEEGTLRPMPD